VCGLKDSFEQNATLQLLSRLLEKRETATGFAVLSLDDVNRYSNFQPTFESELEHFKTWIHTSIGRSEEAEERCFAFLLRLVGYG
jgi:hypothetical protein